MDKENIVQFRYQSNEFLKSESLRSDDFDLQFVDKQNYFDYIPDFHKLLDWINIHLKTWKNAPTYDEIIKRFQRINYSMINFRVFFLFSHKGG